MVPAGIMDRVRRQYLAPLMNPQGICLLSGGGETKNALLTSSTSSSSLSSTGRLVFLRSWCAPIPNLLHLLNCSDGKFVETGEQFWYPDDMTIGFIIGKTRGNCSMERRI